MKEPYSEGLASHANPESCGWTREGPFEALTGACDCRVLSREIFFLSGADAVSTCGSHIERVAKGETRSDPTRSETPCGRRTISHENREIP